MSRRSPGRPPKPPAKKRSEILRIRCTPGEIERYRATAEAQGITVADWARFWLAQGLDLDHASASPAEPE